MNESFETIYRRVIDLQRRIHAHPETGFDTVRTAGLVAEELRDSGVEVRENVGPNGIVGDVIVPGARRHIAFRADMDALDVEEDNDLPHRSTIDGKAHLCGHDGHTAMLLGAARYLAGVRDELPCSLRFIFQPSEEQLPGGAPGMIAAGCLEGIDRIFGIHLWPDVETGAIGIKAGPMMAQPDIFHVTLKGIGGHAALPQKTRDPIPAAAELVTTLQTIVSRHIDPLDSAVVSVTQFNSGSADNIIPESAALAGTFRTFRSEVAGIIHDRFRRITESIAAAHGLEATIAITAGYPVLDNDADACEEAATILDGCLRVARDIPPNNGGEDFSFYLREIPGAFLFLGNRDEDAGITHFCHHPRFRIDDRAMRHGLQAWIELARGARHD